MLNAKWIPAAAAVVGLFAASAASASSLSIGDVVYVSNQDGETFVDGLSAGVTLTVNGSTKNVSAGVFELDYRHADEKAWTSFRSFCLDPALSLTPFSNPFTVIANANAGLEELFGRFYASINNGTSAAAFQVAIWEIVADGLGGSLNDGNLSVGNGAVKTLAAQWLAAIDGSGPRTKLLELDSNGDRSQDLVTVPEPASLALLGLGLLGLGLGRRRR